MEKVAVILGAGASADAWNDTGPPREPAWTPPLARELFGRRPAFWEVLQRYRGARVLAAELGELARVETFSLEAKLREYSAHPDPRIRAAFKEIPPYLRDLINQVVQRYTYNFPIPGTHMRFVMRLLSSGAQVGFIVLNYDDYLEIALGQFDETLLIRNLDDYVDDTRQALVFKVHGSVDWGSPMGEAGRSRWEEAVADFDPASAAESIMLDRSRNETRNWKTVDRDRGNLWLYPVLTAPLAGKGQTDLVCPPNHLKALRRFVADCHKYLVIGTSGLDEDLLSLLAEASPEVAVVHFVNNEGKATADVCDRFSKACPAFRRAFHRAPLEGLYSSGFRAYVGSPEFERFLQE